MGTKEHDKMVRQQCKPIQYSNKILKHLAPLWELGHNNWNNLITIQHHTNEHYTLHISPTNVLMTRLPNADKTGPKTGLRTSLDTLRATLLLPSTTEHKKLPMDTTPQLTTIHTSWIKFIKPDNLSTHKQNSYANLMSAHTTSINTNKRTATQIPDTLPTPDTTNTAPLHITEITDHKTLLQKQYTTLTNSRETTLQRNSYANTSTLASHHNSSTA
jgi:hypothetical protein